MSLNSEALAGSISGQIVLSGNENSESSCKWSDVYWQTVGDEARWVARRSQADEPISKAQRLRSTDPIQNSRSPRQEINRRQRTGENKLAWANNDLTTCTANANQIKAADNAQQVRPCWLANQHWGCRSNADKQSDRWQHADTQNEHTDPWTVTLITSLHTPVHPLITSLHTPVHLLITLSCSQCVDYLCTSVPSLWLPRLHLPALTCACLYFTVFIIWPITFGFVHSGHQHYVAVWGVPFLIIVLFLPVGFWFNKVKKLTCIWTQISTFPRASMLRCDRSLPQLTVYSS